MKHCYIILLVLGSLSSPIYAQYTITLTEACATPDTIHVKGKITYPEEAFAICAYTVELVLKDESFPITINEKTPEGGLFNFFGKVPEALNDYSNFFQDFIKNSKIRVTTNRQTAATIQLKQCRDE